MSADTHDCGLCPFEKRKDGIVVETWRELSTAAGGYYLNKIEYKAIDHKVYFVKSPDSPKPKTIVEPITAEPITIDIDDDDEIPREGDADKADKQIGPIRSDKEPDNMVVVKSENIISINIDDDNNNSNKQEDKSETVCVNNNVSCHNNLLNQSSSGLTKGKESKSQAVKDVTQVKITSNDNNNSNQNQNIPSKRRKSSSDLSSSTSGSSDAIKRKSFHDKGNMQCPPTTTHKFTNKNDASKKANDNRNSKESQAKAKECVPTTSKEKTKKHLNCIDDEVDHDEENSINDNESIISLSSEEEVDSISNIEAENNSNESSTESSSKESIESSADSMVIENQKTSRIELGYFLRSIYPIKEAYFVPNALKVLAIRSLAAQNLKPHPFYFKDLQDVSEWEESELVPLPEELSETQIKQIRKGMKAGKLYNISFQSLKIIYPKLLRTFKEINGTKRTTKRCPLCSKYLIDSKSLFMHIEQLHTKSLLVCTKCNYGFTAHHTVNKHIKSGCFGKSKEDASSASEICTDDEFSDDIDI